MRKTRKVIQKFLMRIVTWVYPIQWQMEDMQKTMLESEVARKMWQKMFFGDGSGKSKGRNRYDQTN